MNNISKMSDSFFCRLKQRLSLQRQVLWKRIKKLPYVLHVYLLVVLMSVAMVGVGIGVGSVVLHYTFSPFKSESISVHAETLDEINNKKSQKEKELSDLQNNINSILQSNQSLSLKITLLKKDLAKVVKLHKDYQKQADSLSNQLISIQEQRKDLINHVGGMVSSAPGFLDFARIFFKNTEKGKEFSFIDSFMTYLIIRDYYMEKVRDLTIKEQQSYGKFLHIKENLQAIVNLEHDTKTHLNQLQAEYKARQQALYYSYSKKAALEHEITVLSRKAQQIIQEKENHAGGNGNSIGDSSGGGGAGNVIPGGSSSGEFRLVIGGQDQPIDGPFYVSVQGIDCSNDPSITPQCPQSYIKVKIFNANKSKNGGDWYYRGVLAFSKAYAGAFFIEKLPLEEYVLGIGEMPSSWGKASGGKGLEALKAQAVASRTYAYAKYLKGYTLSDTTSDQNYVGGRKELFTDGNYWVKAVQQTVGRILKSNGAVITAYYHSSCGGATLSTQEVWGGYRAYAQGISDRYQDSSGKWHPYDKDSPYSAFAWGNADVPMIYLKDLLNAGIYIKLHANGSYVPTSVQDKVACPLPKKTEVHGSLNFANISRVQANRCSGSYTASALASVLGNNAVDKQFDTITKVYATFKDKNNQPAGDQFSVGQHAKYTDSIIIEGRKNGTIKRVYIPGGFFKLAYNLRSPGTNFIRQPSKKGALFDIWQKPGDYSARTYGFGHRVGMCQYGAYGRAKQGQTYAQILSAYYSALNLDGNGLPIKLYSNRGPIISVKITHPGDALCRSSYNCDPSIKNGTYIVGVSANKGSLVIKNSGNETVLTIPSGQVVYIYRQ